MEPTKEDIEKLMGRLGEEIELSKAALLLSRINLIIQVTLLCIWLCTLWKLLQ